MRRKLTRTASLVLATLCALVLGMYALAAMGYTALLVMGTVSVALALMPSIARKLGGRPCEVLHNLFGHPVMELLRLMGLPHGAETYHDSFFPPDPVVEGGDSFLTPDVMAKAGWSPIQTEPKCFANMAYPGVKVEMFSPTEVNSVDGRHTYFWFGGVSMTLQELSDTADSTMRSDVSITKFCSEPSRKWSPIS